MEWQHAFPEMIDAFDAITDQSALQAYIEAVNVAGQERASFEGDLDDDTLDECERFAASAAAAQARVDELKAEAEAAEAAKLAREQRKANLGFRRPEAPPPPAPITTSTTAPEPDAPVPDVFEARPRIIMAHDLNSFKEGQEVPDPVDQARALFERASRLQRVGTGERFTVLQVTDYIDPSLKMPDDGMEQFRFLRDDKFTQDALVAGFCAPADIDLTFCGGSPSTRPVLGSLRRYGAPRGRVRRINTPLFSDVGTDPDEVDDTGIGFWTDADDDAEPFVEKTCSIVTCPTDEEFELYGTYKCVVIKNLMQLAFPEWTAWYLRQLDALWAREAEIRLLNAMVTRAGAAITSTASYGSWATVVTRLNQLMNFYVENERYDDAGLVAWAPRWMLRALQDDHFRRTGTTLPRGAVEAALRDVGITRITWTYDNPTAYNDIVLQAKGAPLNDYPATGWFILSRGDNLRLMDFQARNIGITTERVYRDTTTNVQNNFQMFVEGFEGLIDMGCPVWRFELPICNNGLLAPISGYDPQPCLEETPITG